jgi:hypothetical protein
MYDGIDLSAMTNMESSNMTWDFIKRLRDITKMKIIIKGILAHEDASLCVQNGLDGLIVSNHGGRGEDSGRSTIDALPEIVEAVGGRIPVLVDGGIRRGSDIVKALALGARAVLVGRAYVYGLGAGGGPGVTRAIEILRADLRNLRRMASIATKLRLTGNLPILQIIDELTAFTLREVDFLNEARTCELIRSESPPYVDTPKIRWDLTTRAVLTMEFFDGVTLLSVCQYAESGHPDAFEKLLPGIDPGVEHVKDLVVA